MWHLGDVRRVHQVPLSLQKKMPRVRRVVLWIQGALRAENLLAPAVPLRPIPVVFVDLFGTLEGRRTAPCVVFGAVALGGMCDSQGLDAVSSVPIGV
jgi:hypothetical protein